MLALAVVLGVLAGWLCGGRLRHLAEGALHLPLLPAIALLLQGLAPTWWGVLLSYALLLLFLYHNRRPLSAAVLCGLGCLCNLLVIAANGFCMPVSAQAMTALSPEGLADLLAGRIPLYCAVGEGTRLLFLGDVLYLPLPLIGGFASVGDLLLGGGVVLYLLAAMRPPALARLWQEK